MRVLALILLLAALPLSGAFAQSSPPVPAAAVALSPVSGGAGTIVRAHASGLPPDASAVAVLFSPGGEQQVSQLHADAAGTIDVMLDPPAGGWQVGLYRLAFGYGAGQSASSTFAVSDGHPHLDVEPYLPSPTSAFDLSGVGLPPGASIRLTLLLTGGQQGAGELWVRTDAAGAFSTFVWPQQLGLPFFAAGGYQLQAPDLGLGTSFDVREHPVSASIAVSDPVVPGTPAQVSFENYPRGRYLWGVYADWSGRLAGEFLVGPADIRGAVAASLAFGALSPGRYLLATPYDWGETAFLVPDPTPTPTATATPTLTPTPDPTLAPTPRPIRVATKKARRCRKGQHCPKRRRAKARRPAPGHP